MTNQTNSFCASAARWLCLYALLFVTAHPVQGQSVQFSQGSWQDILNRSEKEKKIIFVDVYTSWCGPCKKMDREVFTKNKLAAYFNDHFINFKIDADLPEGIAFKKRYEVEGYPTFLFIREDGSPLWKEAGYLEEDTLLKLGEKIILLKDDQELSNMKAAYQNGNKEPAFLIRYMQARKERLKADNTEILSQLISQLDSTRLQQAGNLKVITDYFSRANTSAFELIISNYQRIIDEELLTLEPAYLRAIEAQRRQLDQLPASQIFNTSPEVLRKAIVRECLEDRMDRALNNCFAIAARDTNNQVFDLLIVQHLRFNEMAGRRNTKQRNDQLKLQFYRQTEQTEAYAREAEHYINTYILSHPVSVVSNKDSLRRHNAELHGDDENLRERLGKKGSRKLKHLRSQSRKLSQRSDARQLVQTAGEYCDFFEEEKKLLQAVAWVEEAILLYEEPLHYLTYARLIDKLGDRPLALRLLDKGLHLTDGNDGSKVGVSSSTRKREATELKRLKEKLQEGP